MTSCSLSASSVPVTTFPLWSRTRYSNVSAISAPSRYPATGQALELLGVVAALPRQLHRDLLVRHQVRQRLVHHAHPELASGLHGRIDLVHLRFPDQVPDGRRGHHDLRRHHPSLPVPGLEELLGDHALERGAELHPDLLLLVWREGVDAP